MEQLKIEYNSKLSEFNKAWRWFEDLKLNKKTISELKLQEAELKLKRMSIDLELLIIMMKQKGECPTEQEIKEGFKIGVIEGQISL
ncbi:MAG: hypothetical protein LC100_06305 [Chitinophagales bacterium]|nr:hypothetical protein [Chitinophagales bacterium]